MPTFELATPEIWSPSERDMREDGTMKGYGFKGVLKRFDDPKSISSEISIGILPKEVGYDAEKHKDYKLIDSPNGQYLSVPSIVPTLNDKELTYLLSTPEEKISEKDDIMKSIRKKAVDFAKQRMDEGKPLFASPEESPMYGKPMGAKQAVKEQLKGLQ